MGRRIEWVGICDFEGIQLVSDWLGKAERVGAGQRQNGQVKFLMFSDEEELLCIMRDTELEWELCVLQ